MDAWGREKFRGERELNKKKGDKAEETKKSN